MYSNKFSLIIVCATKNRVFKKAFFKSFKEKSCIAITTEQRVAGKMRIYSKLLVLPCMK